MNVLVTGSKGMAGTAMINNLKNIQFKKNTTRPKLVIDNIYEFDCDSSLEELEGYCQSADFVFNFAGVNRTTDQSDYMKGNVGFADTLLKLLKKYNNKATVMYASSIQASLEGRFTGSIYGESKKAGEELCFKYGQETGVRVLVYRFSNIMGHSRPNYNSAVSTFCDAIANDKPYTVNDPTIELELLYIDDLVDAMFDALEGREMRCDYEGMNRVPNENGRYCYVSKTYRITLGEIVNLLCKFKKQPQTLMIPCIPTDSFAKKLYSLYVTYLPMEKFKYELKMNEDKRGSFTELLKTSDHGQFSVNISKPGITKGGHWHNSKWEIFMVVSGHALIKECNINTGESVEFEVCGSKIEAVQMIPGWTHSITNLSDSENLVTLMWANEVFDSMKPDTFAEDI